MKPGFFIPQLLVLLAGFAVINFVVAFGSRHSVPRQLIDNIRVSPPVTDLFAGNSLAEAGFDASAYQAAWPEARALNIGLGSSYPVEHDLLLRRALNGGVHRVYYGFFDTQLTDEPVSDFSDLSGNRTLVHYFDRETAIRLFSANHSIRALRIRLVSLLPVLVERMTLWAKIEVLRRQLGKIGLPPQTTNHFGRARDFSLLEAGDTREFAQRCQQLAERRIGFSVPVVDMITQAQLNGAMFYFVEMPMPKSHRIRFYATREWVAYERMLREQAKRSGAIFIDANDWIIDSNFADPLHLNAQGATAFSRKLATQHSVAYP